MANLRKLIGGWLTAASASAGPAPPPAPVPGSASAPCAGLDGVNEALASKTCAAIRSSGGACHVVSGYRSYAELYQRYLDGTGNLAAPPGRSNHNHGNAVDMSRSCAPHMREQGLVAPVPGEPWHWELPQQPERSAAGHRPFSRASVPRTPRNAGVGCH